MKDRTVLTSNFTYRATPGRVVFGPGSLDRLADEAERLKLTRALVLCSPGRRAMGERAAAILAQRSAGICDAAVTDIPAAAFDTAMERILLTSADGLVSVGGGSSVGLAKAVAAETGLKIIAVATTYSGSELMDSWHVGAGASTRTGGGPKSRPAVIIYDPALTLDLPARASATTGVNGIAHAVESMYAANVGPLALMTGEEGIRLFASSLPRIVADPLDIEARTDALQGAWLCGGFRAGSGLEHRIAQQVRKRFDLEHSAAHAVVLPHVAAFNRAAAPEAMTRIARALGSDDAAAGLFALNDTIGIPSSLKELGMSETGLDEAADIVAGGEFKNPRPASREEIRELLDNALHGRRP